MVYMPDLSFFQAVSEVHLCGERQNTTLHAQDPHLIYVLRGKACESGVKA
jgi:hypothetical protein